MAKIAGITIKLDADASGLEKAVKDIDSSLKKTQSNLKEVNKLLKLDPSSTDLLTQKQKALQDAVTQTGKRLEALKEAQSQVKEGSAEWEALQQEIVVTEQKLKQAEDELKNFGSVAKQQTIAAGEKMKEFGNKVEDVGRKLSKISGVAAGALTALGGIAYKSMQGADELDTLAQKTGVSTDELQKWSYASELVDVDLNTMTGAMAKMKKNMGSGSKAFEELGVATKDADGNFRSATDVFYDTLTALSGIDNETERDIKAMSVFGKSADELAGIIDDGGQSLREYGQEAENLGLIMDTDTIGKLNEANDTVDKLKANMGMSFAQLGATLLGTFGPALEKVAGFLSTLTEKIRNLTPEQAEMIVKILAIVAVIGPLLTVIGSIITGIGTLMTIIPLLAGPIGIVVAAIAAVIAIGVTLYKHWDEIKAWAKETADKIASAWNNMKDKVTTAIDNMKSKAATAWDNMKSTASTKWDDIKNKVAAGVQALKNLMNFQWQLPHLKMPHFNISGTFSLNPPRVPNISVQWYKKAYENAVMFSSPTVMATPNGMKGFGDGHGAEIVMGLNKLRELVGTSGVTINVYPSAGMNETQLAEMVQNKLVQLQKQRDLAYA